MDRRTLLRGAAAGTAALAAARFDTAALAAQGLQYGEAAPFSFEALKARVASMAQGAYAAPVPSQPDTLYRIDYDAHGRIRYRTDDAVFANGPGQYPVTFFHLGRYFQKPVRMHVVSGGQAREILYDVDLFDMPADSPAHELPRNSGFAGFRFQEARGGALDWHRNDWVAFLGASYFRAIGALHQYGLSARGLALNTVVYGMPEEFPDFTHVWFDTPAADAGPGDPVSVYALLDSPSAVGAYRFVMRRGEAVTMDIDTHLVLRRDVVRLGLAPMTSMFWFSETLKPTAVDWRPEVHDSDGLALWTGAGERIWRPLNNPASTQVSAFSDTNPRGFGLIQRDRVFDHYQDGVYYDRRPALWVEPKGEWGAGAVQLVENPTDDEIHDNINAMWVPAAPARAGQVVDLSYRLHWVAAEPYPSRSRAAWRRGSAMADSPGPCGPRACASSCWSSWAALSRILPNGVLPVPVLSASRGEFSYIRTEAVPDDVPGHWRAQFDLATTGTEPVEMRCYLKNGDQVLTETWLYQYHPTA